jgi:hypothetical protein
MFKFIVQERLYYILFGKGHSCIIICPSGVPTGDGELAKSKYAWPAAIFSRYSGLWPFINVFGLQPILELKLQLFLKYSTKTFIIDCKNYTNNDKLI